MIAQRRLWAGMRTAIAIIILFGLLASPAGPVSAQTSQCFTLPDQATHNVSGQVNSYWPGTANAAAGATTITLGTRTGTAVDIAIGDLLMVIQMQGANFSYNNSNLYGSGVAANGGSGYYTDVNLIAGNYEYVVAKSTLGAAGGTLTIAGKGTGNGLMYAYTNATSTTTRGQQRFQVIRVPAYLNVNLTGNVTAAAWNGTTGGVVALEVVNTLTLAGFTFNVNGYGFRGGGGRQLAGYDSPDTDYLTRSTRNANASKGEGLAGMPRYVYDQVNGVLVDTAAPNDGYPSGGAAGGSYARGAPGNGGGGGTDGNPIANDENTGGGGGGNGGTGGLGGNSWRGNQAVGGRNGAAFAQRSASRLVMGGGGGAGTTNNGTPAGTNGLYSSGAGGGGMVFLRLGGISGNGTVSANGATALSVDNDGAGAGGAGGSVLVITNGTALTGLTITANGGNGGNAWASAPNSADRHGPGGGGGGGVVYYTSAPTSVTVTGGAHGITTTSNDAYGSTNGANGVTGTAVIGDIPGAEAGFECYSPTSVELIQLTAKPTSQTPWAIPAGLLLLAASVGALIWFKKSH